MNFYEAQEDARKRTKWLVLYFVIAVVGVVAAVYTVMSFALQFYDGGKSKVKYISGSDWWDTQRFFVVAGLTIGVIILGNLFKSLQLSGGGAAVAQDVGARPVDPHTRDLDEKKLINVVEEMALASGMPVPQVWIMDNEMGINAFAAGTEPGNAVIGVTRGCIQKLTRGELQGVIAHEFSHILNGDMKLNMRLIGWLFGIMMLSILGRMLLESLQFVRIRGNSKDNNGGFVIVLIVAGIALLVIGAVGVFFARMIQAAISRQREFLADASAVEFTRDPSSIAGALKKIGGQEYGSQVKHAKASEASHMFFADGGMFSYGFATHPPLDVRISTIEKDWDGKFSGQGNSSAGHEEEADDFSEFSDFDERLSGFSGASHSKSNSVKVDRQQWDELGDSSHQNVMVGKQLHGAISAERIAACRDKEYAQSLIYGLLMSEDHRFQDSEVSYLIKNAGQSAADQAKSWNGELRETHSAIKIALLDLSIPTLRSLSMPEYEKFIGITRWMISSDGQVDMFEFMLQKMLERHLSNQFLNFSGVKVRYTEMNKLSSEVNVLISTMAGVGAKNNADLTAAYQLAANELQNHHGGEKITILPPDRCGLQEVDKALNKINQASPMIKKHVLHACGLAVMQDGEMQSIEAEMLRAIADSIGSILPPFL